MTTGRTGTGRTGRPKLPARARSRNRDAELNRLDSGLIDLQNSTRPVDINDLERAEREAEAVDDDALAAIADALVLGLVLPDIAAMVARDMQVGARWRRDQNREGQQGKGRDAHGSIRNRIAVVRRGIVGP